MSASSFASTKSGARRDRRAGIGWVALGTTLARTVNACYAAVHPDATDKRGGEPASYDDLRSGPCRTHHLPDGEARLPHRSNRRTRARTRRTTASNRPRHRPATRRTTPKVAAERTTARTRRAPRSWCSASSASSASGSSWARSPRSWGPRRSRRSTAIRARPTPTAARSTPGGSAGSSVR